MGRFIVFLLVLAILSVIGMAMWWIWNGININIERRRSVFDIEKETHEKMRKRIKEDGEE